MFDKIVITSEMLNLISEIDEFKGAWCEWKRLAPERLSMLKKIATIESVGSSTRIEGAQLSDSEVENVLKNIDARSFASRDEQEVAGYAYVCEKIGEEFLSIPFSENVIKQLHMQMLNYSDRDARHQGEYKKAPIRIEAFDAVGKSMGIIFETVSPIETPDRMQELVVWTQNALAEKKLHPLIVIALFVAIFLAIHPFQDGNGRLSRILTTLLLLQAGYAYLPYSSLESVIENSKEAYYLALRQTQSTLNTNTPDWQPWLLFFLRALQQQKRRLAAKVEREQSAITLTDLAVKILDYARDHGRVTTRDMVREHGASANTLKATFSSLVEKRLLVRHGGGRSTWYALQ